VITDRRSRRFADGDTELHQAGLLRDGSIAGVLESKRCVARSDDR